MDGVYSSGFIGSRVRVEGLGFRRYCLYFLPLNPKPKPFNPKFPPRPA